MKGLHPSFRRVRSNSLTSVHRPLHTNTVAPVAFFDTPPPPTRPGIITVSKGLAGDHPNHNSTQHSSHNGGHPPLPLALGTTTSNSSQSQSQYAMFPYSTTPTKNHVHPYSAQAAHEPHLRAPKRQRLKYQLDVGAYGIAKRRNPTTLHQPHSIHSRISPKPTSTEDLNLAVQVGEDAYFVRDNAMGVADGVGGWAKKSQRDTHSPSPSALFARRLMHYCSAEVDSVTSARSTVAAPSRPQFSFQHHLKPRSNPLPIHSTPHSSWLWNAAEQERLRREELEQDLEDSLEELSEGIDVLQILEQAYDRTIKAHVATPSTSSQLPTRVSADPLSAPLPPVSQSSPTSAAPIRSQSSAESTPLMSGSSTALLAVLDHAPRHRAGLTNAAKPPRSEASVSALPTAATSPSNPSTAIPMNYAAGTLHPSITLDEQSDACDAVIRVAHIGDCMGMLVRGEEIVWRSEEMWWDFNMPLQLGPMTHPVVTPTTSAHYFTLPVKADDILILASDGLSDNLWDEEVLDEVVKFRRSFLGGVSQDIGDSSMASAGTPAQGEADRLIKRKALAGMLSEALCSRARKVSERKWTPKSSGSSTPREGGVFSMFSEEEEDEVPFARRAREAGRVFKGGKHDDISVIVAVISPAEDAQSATEENASLSCH